ncbi:MAG: hypothetical protein QOE35_3489 [Actinomycetota bacterium]|jgi:glycosyltransferase involved in cell wall biosynthesis
MKIVFLAWRDLANPLAGGSEVLIDKLASGLATRGHDVTLVCGGPVESHDYRVIEAGERFSQYFKAPAAAMRHCRDADVMIDVANGMSYLTPLWRRRPSICFVNHVHTAQWSQWFNPTLAALGRTIERRVTPRLYRHRLFIAVSPSTADSLMKIGVRADQIRIVPNGVDVLQTPLADKSTEPLFVAVGRLVPHKRFHLLLPMWERVRATTGGRLVIVGEGPERERLEAMAGPGVEFTGYVSEEEKQRLYQQAWLLLHPAEFEGWGLVITEAGSAGTAALGFDVPGVRDSIAHGESGVVVSTPVEMAAEWLALTADPDRRRALEAGARSRAHAYSTTKTVDRFLEVAEEAVDRRRVRSRRPDAAAARPAAAPIRRSAIPARAGPDVSIVVPAYNEALRLRRSLPLLAEAARRFNSELIVVDDGSTDGTAEVAAALLANAPRPSLLRLPVNRGKGAAVRAGVAHATGRNIVFMDADLATDISHLSEVLEALKTAHVAVGNRAARGSIVTGATQSRRVIGRVFNEWARAVTGADLSDFQCGFKGFRAPVAKILFDLSQVDGFAFDVDVLALAHRIGYRTVEIPIRWHAVEGGHVRPLRDAPAMGLSVVLSRLRWGGDHSVAALRAAARQGWEGDEVAAALAALLPGSGTVVPWRRGALALLPFVDDPDAARTALRLQQEQPELEVHSARLDARDLLSATGRDLRNAIVAA